MATTEIGDCEIGRVEHPRHRPVKITDQHDAHTVAFVIYLMFQAVVEDDAFTLFPDVGMVLDAHGRRVVFRDDESEVVAQVAHVGSAMRRDGFSGVEDGEERLIEIGDAFKKGRGAGAAVLVRLRLARERPEHEDLPVFVGVDSARNVLFAGSDVVVAGEVRSLAQQHFHFFADDGVVAVKFAKAGVDLIDVVKAGASVAAGVARIEPVDVEGMLDGVFQPPRNAARWGRSGCHKDRRRV